MPTTEGDKIADEALELPAEARIPDIDRLWADEAEHRVAEIGRGEVDLIPGAALFDKIRRKYST